MLLAGWTVVGAQAQPGPNGKNNHGLCTAYFNGQKKGHTKHGSPPPFAALEAAAEEAEMSIYEYCSQFGIGGNPGHNGRFPECFDDDDSTGNDACPSD
jgi:hypothetical protein